MSDQPTAEAKPAMLDIAKLPPSVLLMLALTGAGTGIGSLGLRFGDPEPPATAAEVQELRSDLSELREAVRELGFQIRLHHERGP